MPPIKGMRGSIRMYKGGRGAPLDFQKATEWFQMAADQGHACAQFHVGMAYITGEGVPRDYPKAMQWFRKAGDQGHSGGVHNVATMYFDDQGVSQDKAKALEWAMSSFGPRAVERKGYPISCESSSG